MLYNNTVTYLLTYLLTVVIVSYAVLSLLCLYVSFLTTAAECMRLFLRSCTPYNRVPSIPRRPAVLVHALSWNYLEKGNSRSFFSRKLDCKV